MRDGFEIQAHINLVRELHSLADTQPKAVKLMALILFELDADNKSQLRIDPTCRELETQPGRLLEMARTLQGIGLLETLAYSDVKLFIRVHESFARFVC